MIYVSLETELILEYLAKVTFGFVFNSATCANSEEKLVFSVALIWPTPPWVSSNSTVNKSTKFLPTKVINNFQEIFA